MGGPQASGDRHPLTGRFEPASPVPSAGGQKSTSPSVSST
jgi:hypothetical protein